MLNSLKDLINLDNNDKILGEGAFSEVIRVRSRFDNKIYALKKIDISKLSRSDCQNLKTEIKLHKTLNHPYIIKFHDALQIKNMVYFLLEYANNGCLFFYINPRYGMGEKIALRMFYQICKGIEYLHSQNLIHRDIKPENILLDENFDVKICDFGWSCIVEDGDVRSSICGTFEYMSPEIVYSGKHSKKVDIWCLGILLYEMLHGAPPYVASSMEDIKNELGGKNIVINSNLSEDCKNFLKFILRMDEDVRPDIKQVLKHPAFLKNLNKFKEPILEEDFVLLMQNYLLNCQSGKRNLPESIEQVFKKKKQNNRIPNFDKSYFTRDSIDRFFTQTSNKIIDFDENTNYDFFKSNSKNFFKKKENNIKNEVQIEKLHQIPDKAEIIDSPFKLTENKKEILNSAPQMPEEKKIIRLYSENKFFDKHFKNHDYFQNPVKNFINNTSQNPIKSNINNIPQNLIKPIIHQIHQNSINSANNKSKTIEMIKFDNIKQLNQKDSPIGLNRSKIKKNLTNDPIKKKNSFGKCAFNDHVFTNLRSSGSFKNNKDANEIKKSDFTNNFSIKKLIKKEQEIKVKNKKNFYNEKSLKNNFEIENEEFLKKSLKSSDDIIKKKNNLDSKQNTSYNLSTNVALKKNLTPEINKNISKKNSLEQKIVVSDFKFILKGGVLTKVPISKNENKKVKNLENVKKTKFQSYRKIEGKKKNINELKKEVLSSFKNELKNHFSNLKFQKTLKSDNDKNDLDLKKKDNEEKKSKKFLVDSKINTKINDKKNNLNSYAFKKNSQNFQIGNSKTKSLFTNYDFSVKK